MAAAVASAASAQDPAAAAIERLRTLSEGKLAPDSVAKSPISGLLEVRQGRNVYYADPTGRFVLIEGHIIDLEQKRDLTQASIDDMLRIDFAKLPKELALKTVRGNGKRVFAVFEDPNCPICRSFRSLLNQLEDVTIYTYAYPVLSADSQDKARAAVCAANPVKAWDDLMRGNTAGSPPAQGAACAARVAQTINLGARLGVNGTPTVFFADGSRAEGAVAPDAFIRMLDEAAVPKQAAARK